MHFRRSIFHRANEIFRIALARQPLGVRQRHAIRAVLRELHRPAQHSIRPDREIELLVGTEDHPSRRGWQIGVDEHADVGAGRCVDIAAIFLNPRRETQGTRIGVLDVDARDARGVHHRDGIRFRRHGAGDHAVVKRRRQAVQRKREAAGRILWHLGRVPVVVVTRFRPEQLHHDRRLVADEPRHDGDVRTVLNARVTGRDLENDMRREQREGDRVVGLPRFVADEERRSGQQQDRRNGLNPGPPQDFGGDDLGRIDGGCRASRIAHHGRREPRRRRLLRDDADRAHEPVVELRLALFDEPGNSRVGRSLAQRQQPPRPRRRRRDWRQGSRAPRARTAPGLSARRAH